MSTTTASALPTPPPSEYRNRLSKRSREEWDALVDAISSERSTDVASLSDVKDMDALASLLPRVLSSELKDSLQSDVIAFDAVQKCTFQPQISLEEGYHTRPIPFRSSDLFTKNVGSGMIGASSTGADSSSSLLAGFTGAVSAKALRRLDAAKDAEEVAASQLMNRKAASIAPLLKCITRKLGTNSNNNTNGASKENGTAVVGLDRLTRDDLLFGSTERLTSGFRRQKLLNDRYARPDFLPIILIPSGPSAALQLFNVRAFLEEGDYIHPSQAYMSATTGDTSREDAKPENVVVSPKAFFSAETLRGCAFQKFRVVDDPRKIDNWDHVCACIVTGVEWQLKEWFSDVAVDTSVRRLSAPSALFDFLRGYLCYFEEDKLPVALAQWKVQPLVLTRKYVKAKSHILQAYTFWEELYQFISTNKRFSHYVASGVDEA